MDETMTPTTMQSFTVVKQVGKGAFGTVFKVIRKSDNKVYAIKTINIGKMDKKTIASNLNEIRILSSFSHPNIVGYKEAFLEKKDTEMCIVMEFVGGGDLAGKISDCKKRKMHLNEESVWKFFIQTLMGLKAFHDMKIIHRDIKSANLFLSEDYETIKVGDLNVAKVTKNDLAQTQIGTPYYLAPEIWNNQVYTNKCDVFSLGVVLYEMCALAVPFEANSIAELCRKITKGTFGKIPSKYSEDMYTIISMMLTKDPKRRPSVDQLLEHPIITSKMLSQNIEQFRNKEVAQRLMGTIVVPKNLNQLNQVLPKQKKYRASAKSVDNLGRLEKDDFSEKASVKGVDSPNLSARKQPPETPKKVGSKAELPPLKAEPASAKKDAKLPPVTPKPLPPAKGALVPNIDVMNKAGSAKKVDIKAKAPGYQDYAGRAPEVKRAGRARVSSADKRPSLKFF